MLMHWQCRSSYYCYMLFDPYGSQSVWRNMYYVSQLLNVKLHRYIRCETKYICFSFFNYRMANCELSIIGCFTSICQALSINIKNSNIFHSKFKCVQCPAYSVQYTRTWCMLMSNGNWNSPISGSEKINLFID